MATPSVDRVELLEGIAPQTFAAIEREVFPVPWHASSFVTGAAYLGWSLKQGAQALGFLYVQKVLDEAEIIRIAVLPEHQRRGFAKRLWLGLIDHARCRDLTRVFLEVAVGNRPARVFYESLGFQVSGVRPDYYGSGEDALTMHWCATGKDGVQSI